MLLPPAERSRWQALAAFAVGLFDFARQDGVEGERLAALNRWEFDLESALAGDPPLQPIFVRMAAEEQSRPWPRAPLARLGELARRRAVAGVEGAAAGESRPAGGDLFSQELAAALVHALLGEPPPPSIARLGAALLDLRRLCLAFDPGAARGPEGTLAPEATARDARRIRSLLLGAAKGIAALPPSHRRAGLYLLLAGLRLVTQLEVQAGPRAPRLGLVSRLGLLLRARWLRSAAS
jgi:hypothetical protein